MARRDRRRAIPALAASLLVHLALLIVFAHVAGVSPRASEPVAEPDFQVQLVTRPPPAAPNAAIVPRSSRQVLQATPPAATRRAPPRPRLAPTTPPQAVQVARPAPPHAPRAPATPPSHASDSTPAAGPNSGAAAGSGAPGGGRWAVQGEDEGQDGVRKFLRATVGCSHEDYVKLTEPERAACDRRVGRDARMIGSTRVEVPAEKQGYYAAAQEAYQSLHDPRPRYDAQGNRVLAGHMPSIGCKIGGKDAPPNSLKLGPCYVTPPQGAFTEESGIPKP